MGDVGGRIVGKRLEEWGDELYERGLESGMKCCGGFGGDKFD